MLLYDKTSRMMKVDEARQHQFFKQTRGLQIIQATQTALISTLCVQRTDFSGLRSSEQCIEKGQRLLDSTARGWQGDRHVKLAAPGLAEPPSAGKHNADISEKHPSLSVSTTLEKADPFVLRANSLFCQQYCRGRSAHYDQSKMNCTSNCEETANFPLLCASSLSSSSIP